MRERVASLEAMVAEKDQRVKELEAELVPLTMVWRERGHDPLLMGPLPAGRISRASPALRTLCAPPPA